MSDDHSITPGPRDRELFLAALELPEEAREGYLRAQCGHDTACRNRVLGLLAEHVAERSFLEHPAVARSGNAKFGTGGTLLSTTNSMGPGAQVGERIGRYKLLQQIGEGGCGVVYMAEQEEPVRRRVALKIIKLGMDTKGVIARFEAERQALAMMDHPNIARVLDAGSTETGRPYFVMELVRGIKITEYADQNNLSTEDRLTLFIQVCNAIQHAHQKGIIHRDIKPSNILVTLHDGVPIPKVIDFGIAKAIEQKLTDKTLFTLFQSFIGTPAYMSPEQAEMSGLDIDTRSDIYALGVLLYELLTGQTPFDPEALISKGIDECRKTIREKEPARPSTKLATMLEADLTSTAERRRTDSSRLIHLMQGDLDWIVMKCLEKDRARRYDTAVGLAADVQRYLSSEAVLARPPSNLYRLRKFLRKNRGPVSAAAAIAAILIVGITVSTWLAIRATVAQHEAAQNAFEYKKAAKRAEQEKQAAHLNEYVADISLAQQALKDQNLAKSVQLLRKLLPEGGEPDLRGFEWRYLWEESKGDKPELLTRQPGASITTVAISPDGHKVAIAVDDRQAPLTSQSNISIWNLQNKSLVANVPTRMTRMRGDRPPKPPERDSPPPPHGPRFGPPSYDSLAFVNDGKVLVAASQNNLRRWSAEDGTELEPLPARLSGPIAATADGRLLVAMRRGFKENREDGAVGSESSAVVLNTSDWSIKGTFRGATSKLALSPDGRFLATDTDQGIAVWTIGENSDPVILENSTNLFGMMLNRITRQAIAFSPDGRFVVAPRNTPTPEGVFVVSIWNAHTGRALGTLPAQPEQIEHLGVITAVAFSPDGRLLATGSLDHSIRLWDMPTNLTTSQSVNPHPRVLLGQLNEVWTLAFSPDGNYLVSGAKDGTVMIWLTHPQPKHDTIVGRGEPLGFSPDSRTLATVTVSNNDLDDNFLTLLNFASHEPVRTFRLQREIVRGRHGPGNDHPFPFALSADLGTFAQMSTNGAIRVWNTASDESRELPACERHLDNLTLSPDGRYLIGGSFNQMASWWDLRAGTTNSWDVNANAFLFSPDGRFIATFHNDSPPQIWSVPGRKLLTTLETSESAAPMLMFRSSSSAAFSPNGRRLAVTCSDHTIGIWDVATGKVLGYCSGHKQPAFTVAFSPDGLTLASASADSTLRLWNVETQQELTMDRRLGDGMRDLHFSPDGRFLVGAYGTPEASVIRIFSAPAVADAELRNQMPGQQARVN